MPQSSRIALFTRALDEGYQTLQREACRAAARRHDFTVRELSSHNDAAVQARRIEDCLEAPESVRPRAILVCPVLEASLELVARQAARLGVGFVLLNRSPSYLEALRREYPKVPLFAVLPNQLEVGRMQGRQFRILLRNGGDLLYIRGTAATSASQLRHQGVSIELADAPIRLVTEEGDWSAKSGEQAVGRWLMHHRAGTAVDCVVGAQNDTMADGARAALDEASKFRAQLGKVWVTGCDGTLQHGQRLVDAKILCATVIIPSTADRAVDELAAVFSSGRCPTADVSVLNVSSYPDLDVLRNAYRSPLKK